MASKKKLRPRERVEPYALALEAQLIGSGIRAQTCGSIRRLLPKVADIDLVVSPPLRKAAEVLLEMDGKVIPGINVKVGVLSVVCLSNIENCKKTANLMVNGVQVDLYEATEEQWAAMTLFLTGSKLCNVVMRGKAKAQGLRLNQYGLWHGDEVIAGRSERQIFEALGLEYLTPEERSLEVTGRKIKEVE
jgi:DNA polymerase (family 10)